MLAAVAQQASPTAGDNSQADRLTLRNGFVGKQDQASICRMFLSGAVNMDWRCQMAEGVQETMKGSAFIVRNRFTQNLLSANASDVLACNRIVYHLPPRIRSQLLNRERRSRLTSSRHVSVVAQ